MKTINRADDRLTRKTGPIILASFIRTLKGGLGLWCTVGPLMPLAFFDSNLIAAIISISVAIVIYGLIIWKYRTGSAATIRAIFRGAGLGVVFSLLGGFAIAVLFGANIGGGALFVTWGCFLYWSGEIASPFRW